MREGHKLINHISSDLSIDNVSKLKEWYKYYHRLCTYYKWKYKKFKKVAYTTYKKVLTQIRSYLRGLSYDEKAFLDEVRVMDDIVTDLCPTVSSMSSEYDKKYGNI